MTHSRYRPLGKSQRGMLTMRRSQPRLFFFVSLSTPPRRSCHGGKRESSMEGAMGDKECDYDDICDFPRGSCSSGMCAAHAFIHCVLITVGPVVEFWSTRTCVPFLHHNAALPRALLASDQLGTALEQRVQLTYPWTVLSDSYVFHAAFF